MRSQWWPAWLWLAMCVCPTGYLCLLPRSGQVEVQGQHRQQQHAQRVGVRLIIPPPHHEHVSTTQSSSFPASPVWLLLLATL